MTVLAPARAHPASDRPIPDHPAHRLAPVDRLADDPADAGAWTALGSQLHEAGDLEAADLRHRRALTIDPAHELAWGQRAAVLTLRGRHAQAVACLRMAVVLRPDGVPAGLNVTGTLYKAGDFDTGLTMLERFLRLEPGNTTLLWGRAQIRLHGGDYAQGFADYEFRYWLNEYRYRLHRGPRWDGASLEGKFIMVTLEQGLGDTLLAARFLPMLKALGARRVMVELRDELRRLLTPTDGVDAFIRENAAPTPIYHAHSSIMSLPLRLGTTIDRVPPPVRLTIPAEAHAKAARLLGPDDGRLKVGIVWSGNTAYPDNAIRATGLGRFLRFLEVPGVAVYSLQKGAPEQELQALPPDTPITPLGPELDDLADTAAVVERLDLVIMTDSSVAHLAGSLGRPVWNLVQHVPYWVYGRSGATTPWYPSMRLYRQGPDEDWEPVFAAALRDLRALAGQRPDLSRDGLRTPA